MLSTELHAAALTFSQALREAPAVATYRGATDALAEDRGAQQAMVALQGAQASYTRAQQAGQNPNQEQVDQLRGSQSAVRANEVLMNHIRATNAVKAYLPMVAGEVTTSLGADYASLIAPSSGC